MRCRGTSDATCRVFSYQRARWRATLRRATRRDRVSLHDERRTHGRAPRSAESADGDQERFVRYGCGHTHLCRLGWSTSEQVSANSASVCVFCVPPFWRSVMSTTGRRDRVPLARRTQNARARSARDAESAEGTRSGLSGMDAAAPALSESFEFDDVCTSGISNSNDSDPNCVPA